MKPRQFEINGNVLSITDETQSIDQNLDIFTTLMISENTIILDCSSLKWKIELQENEDHELIKSMIRKAWRESQRVHL